MFGKNQYLILVVLYMYFTVLGGESVLIHKFGRPNAGALGLLPVNLPYDCNDLISFSDQSQTTSLFCPH